MISYKLQNVSTSKECQLTHYLLSILDFITTDRRGRLTFMGQGRHTLTDLRVWRPCPINVSLPLLH